MWSLYAEKSTREVPISMFFAQSNILCFLQFTYFMSFAIHIFYDLCIVTYLKTARNMIHIFICWSDRIQWLPITKANIITFYWSRFLYLLSSSNMCSYQLELQHLSEDVLLENYVWSICLDFLSVCTLKLQRMFPSIFFSWEAECQVYWLMYVLLIRIISNYWSIPVTTL